MRIINFNYKEKDVGIALFYIKQWVFSKSSDKNHFEKLFRGNFTCKVLKDVHSANLASFSLSFSHSNYKFWREKRLLTLSRSEKENNPSATVGIIIFVYALSEE